MKKVVHPSLSACLVLLFLLFGLSGCCYFGIGILLFAIENLSENLALSVFLFLSAVALLGAFLLLGLVCTTYYWLKCRRAILDEHGIRLGREFIPWEAASGFDIAPLHVGMFKNGQTIRPDLSIYVVTGPFRKEDILSEGIYRHWRWSKIRQCAPFLASLASRLENSEAKQTGAHRKPSEALFLPDQILWVRYDKELLLYIETRLNGHAG